MKFLLLSLLASSALLTMAMEDTKDLFDIDAILQDGNGGDSDWLNFTFEPEPSAEKEKRARSPQIEFGTADQTETNQTVRSKMPRVNDIPQNAAQPARAVSTLKIFLPVTCLACLDKLGKSSDERAALRKNVEDFYKSEQLPPSYDAHMYDFLPNSPVRRIVPICTLQTYRKK